MGVLLEGPSLELGQAYGEKRPRIRVTKPLTTPKEEWI